MMEMEELERREKVERYKEDMIKTERREYRPFSTYA
jgi:hypothetical protein